MVRRHLVVRPGPAASPRFLLGSLAAALALGCSKAPPPEPVQARAIPDVVLPDAPGKDKVESSCVACHTTRYVTEQPPLRRATWQAEVDKMRTTFGAPVAPDDVPAIVDYLVAVRGTGG